MPRLSAAITAPGPNPSRANNRYWLIGGPRLGLVPDASARSSGEDVGRVDVVPAVGDLDRTPDHFVKECVERANRRERRDLAALPPGTREDLPGTGGHVLGDVSGRRIGTDRLEDAVDPHHRLEGRDDE